jgi:UDP-glucose 4-epimerase
MEQRVMSTDDRIRRIAITGAAGFLGTHLAEEIRRTYPEIAVIGVDPKQPDRVIEGVRYRNVLEPVDLVFHLAGWSDVPSSFSDPASDLASNAGLTLDILQACRGGVSSRVVIASSVAVYGRFEGVAEECEPPNPASPYGISKVAAEQYTKVYGSHYGLDGRVARIGNAYGPGQARLLIYDLAVRALQHRAPLRYRGDGEEIRDFVHARDVARALILIGFRGEQGGVYNVASGSALAVKRVAEMVAVATGLSSSEVEPDMVVPPETVRVSYPSVGRLKGLGFKPTVDLERGIEETTEWVRNIR